MTSPLTIVLAKIFVRGFYRRHGGMLLFLFVTLITYWFFINVLNETHLAPEERIVQNLLLVLTVLSSPVMTGIVFIAWLLFTVKSWTYISDQMTLPVNQFLFYSITSFNKSSQLKSWFIIQLLISIPLLAYGLFSLVIGLIYDYHAVPILIFCYIVLLALISAFIYVKAGTSTTTKPKILSEISKRWRKPFFSLFLYHIAHRLKINFTVTKLLSYGIITGGSYLLQGETNNTRAAEIIILGVVIAHAVLIFQSDRFENSYLSFSRNFPFTKIRTYSTWGFTYLLLTLPENSWLLMAFDIKTATMLVLFNLSTALLFRSLLFSIIPEMKKYLYWIFYLFILYFLLILFRAMVFFIPLNFFVSFVLHSVHYWKRAEAIRY
jgi:hypothetical protein